MQSLEALKINAVAEFAASIYGSDAQDALIARDGETREEAVLRAASDHVLVPQNPGVLRPELREMLDAMTQDYAKILTRIDDIARLTTTPRKTIVLN